MLLPLKPDTPLSAIFKILNEEIGYFLNQCVSSTCFEITLFSSGLRDTIWSNKETRIKFESLWNEIIAKLAPDQRKEFSDHFKQSQNFSLYFQNKSIPFPNISSDIIENFSDLTIHLFNRTSKLRGIETCCGETIQSHFNNFCETNGKVCSMCGTDILAQYRAGVDESDQWRGPYDHLLPKEKYPIYAIHPENLIPICHHCNSKAKLSKDLLIDKNNYRRLSFYPLKETAYEYVSIHIDQSDINLTVQVVMESDDICIAEKLETWNDVYRITERIEGEFQNLIEIVEIDCCPHDLNELQEQVNRKASAFYDYIRFKPWYFWKYKLYDWMKNNSDIIDILWNLICNKRADSDAASVYGI